jgi:predicted ATPase
VAETLLQVCPEIKILATSREAMAVSGEVPWTVPSLSVAGPADSEDPVSLMQWEAVRLFVERAAAVQPGFALTPDLAPWIAQICRRLDGIPLAIELAAARVRVLTVGQIAGRLDDRFRLLTGGSRTALPRHHTLVATMDWSYDLLDEQDRVLFRRLSVFSGTCTLDAAEEVCAGNGLESKNVLDVLVRLVDRSLVVVEEREGQARYRMLETVRQYGRDRLLESGEVRSVRDRHLEYFLALAEGAEPALQGPDQKTWFDRLEAEHDNLRAALEWSLGEDRGDAGLRLAGALWWFWYVRGYLTEGAAWLREALKRDGHTKVRIRALTGAAALSIFIGDHAETSALGNESLALARELDDAWGMALSLIVLSVTALAQGQRDRAATLIEESLTLTRRMGHQWGIAIGLAIQGRLASARRELALATALLEESLALFRQLGDRWGIAFSQAGLGLAARLAGDYDRAAVLYREALATSRDLGNKQGVAWSLFESGQARLRQRDYARAAMLFAESRELFVEMGEKPDAAYALHYQGLVANYLGDQDRAEQFFNESLSAFDDLGRQDGRAYALEGLGRINLQRGELERAAVLAEESLTIFRAAQDRWGQATALHLMGRIALQRGDGDQAAALGEQSLDIFRQLNDRWAVAPLLRFLGYATLALKRFPDAALRFAESLQLRAALGDQLGVAEGLEGLAAVEEAEQHGDQAAWLLGAASAVRDAIGAPIPPHDRISHGRLVASVRHALGEAAASAAWTRGRALPLEQIIQDALRRPPGAGEPPPDGGRPAPSR